MSSATQHAANRANAGRGTGPATEEAKAASFAPQELIEIGLRS